MADLSNIPALKAAISAILNNGVPDESIEPDEHNDLLVDLLDTITGLDKALRANNETGGFDVILTEGDVLRLKNSGFTGGIVPDTLTGDQTYTFQDASGTVAFLSDITGGATNLAEANATTTTVDVTSDTGTDATLQSASTIRAGLMSKAKFDEVEANNSKVSNVSTDLSIGTVTGTTVDVNSSDGTNATIPQATITEAGLMSAADKVILDNITDTDDQTATEVTYSNATSGLTATDVQAAIDEVELRVDTNDAKVSNVTTNLGTANNTATNIDVTSSDGTEATLPSATPSLAGLMSATDKTKLDGISDTDDQNASEVPYTNTTSGLTATDVQAAIDEVEGRVDANDAKVSNVSTDLSEGTTTNTTVDVNSSDGTNATLAEASTSRAGVLSKAKFDEIVANTAKVSNVTTDLSEGTSTTTTVDVNSSDGTNATLQPASTIRAGVMSKAKFDEVEVNNAKVSNATHTGEVTGSGALTLDKTAISNRSDVTITASDVIIYGDATDSDNLKKDTVQGILDLVSGGGATEAGTGTDSLQQVGVAALATATHSLALLRSANATVQGCIAIGQLASATAQDGLAMLAGANVNTGTDAMSIGRAAVSTNSRAISIGLIATTSGYEGISIGREAGVSASFGIAMGGRVKSTAISAFMFGGGNSTRTNSTASSVEFNFDEVTSTIRLAKSADSWINTGNNFGIGNAAPSEKLDVSGRVFMANQADPLTPTGGGIIYVSGGALKYKGSSGTITTIAVA